MTIIALNKVTVCGASTDKEIVLAGLQKLGCLHLIPLQAAPEDTDDAAANQDTPARQAWRHLISAPRMRKQVRDRERFNLDGIVRATLKNKRRFREVEDRRAFLAHRIDQLTQWGNFVLPEETLGGYRLWFYRVPHNKAKLLGDVELPWQKLSEDNQYLYVAVMAQEEPGPDVFPVPRTHTGSLPLEELERQLDATEIELEDLTAEHESLSRWRYLLEKSLNRAEDEVALRQADQQVLDREGILAVQGWAPQRQSADLEQFAQQHGLALLIEEVGPDDAPPTLMENPPLLAGGQDLVGAYQIPGYRDWDPSSVIFFSWGLFFAMIMADTGYSLVLAVPLLYNWGRLGKSAIGKRMRTLFAWILGACVVYGILVGSYFGFPPPEGSFLEQLKILEVNDFDVMLPLSIFIGCAHLIYANAAAALAASKLSSKMTHIAWILVVCGGFSLFILGGENGSPTATTAGIGLLIAGLATLVLMGSDRKIDSISSVFLRLLDGAMKLTGITSMFGDVLSYLRLFALGLSSASLAITFNDLSRLVADSVPGLGILLAIGIFILGHGINLLLAIISGVVHGLRLNFIEFFRWGLEEEGYSFQPFAKKEIES
ncbi:MAG: V-type ATP synthase subunit I [Synechococcus sp.]